jgi:hypothetical protein
MSNANSGWGGARPGAGRPQTVEAEREERYRRRDILIALAGAPFGYSFRLREQVETFTDAELLEAFESWARDEREWDEHCYAYHRFIRGLNREEACAALNDAYERREDREFFEIIVRYNIRRPDDPAFGRRPREQVEELLARARPLQAPLTCWKCEARPALSTGYHCAECEGNP